MKPCGGRLTPESAGTVVAPGRFVIPLRLGAPFLLTLALVATSGCGTVGRVGDLFVSGGGTVLREALRAGDMPRPAALLGAPAGENLWAHAVTAPGVLSVLPAETSVGWATVFTGETPARSGDALRAWMTAAVGPGPTQLDVMPLVLVLLLGTP